ncbi:MAG: hypothetical protein V1743_06540 [Nanoarchaeota archaeon]
MNETKDLERTYDSCIAEGFIRFRKDVDKELAKSLLESAQDGIERLNMKELNYEKKTKNYSVLFTEHYDILRKLIDAAILFDKATTANHQCSNAFLCIRHENWEFDWETIESMRILRNDVNYKGRKIDYAVWKSFEIKFTVYFQTLVKIINERLNEQIQN